MPAYARENCPVTIGAVTTQADLEVRDRARGEDVAGCDARRALAVAVDDANAQAAADWTVARARRQSWVCRALGLGCGR